MWKELKPCQPSSVLVTIWWGYFHAQRTSMWNCCEYRERECGIWWQWQYYWLGFPRQHGSSRSPVCNYKTHLPPCECHSLFTVPSLQKNRDSRCGNCIWLPIHFGYYTASDSECFAYPWNELQFNISFNFERGRPSSWWNSKLHATEPTQEHHSIYDAETKLHIHLKI